MKRVLDKAKQLNGEKKEAKKNTTAVEDEPEELRGMCDAKGTLYLVDDATRRVFAAERDDEGKLSGGGRGSCAEGKGGAVWRAGWWV
jgi:hypothetical protein